MNICKHTLIISILLIAIVSPANAEQRQSRGTSEITPHRIFLIQAAFTGDIRRMKELINRGADVNAYDDGMTPLIGAALTGRVEAVKLLLDNGALVDTRNDFGMTVLYVAAKATDNRQEVVDILIKYGASVNIEDKNRDTPLKVALDRNDMDISEILLANGADINYQDKNGNTLLHSFTGATDSNKLKYALDNGANVNIFNKMGDTPLMNAASRGSKKIVELLIDRGAEIDEVNLKGKTALLKAVSSGHSDIVKLLIATGADINIQDNEGNTPMAIAKQSNNKKIVYSLRQSKMEIKSGSKLRYEELSETSYQKDIVDTRLNMRDCNVEKAQDIRVAIGSSVAPMYFLGMSRQRDGFEIDLLELFAGMYCLKPIFINPIEHGSSSVNMVVSGTADLALDSIVISREGRKWVEFSAPYFISGVGFLMRAEDKDRIDFNSRTYLFPEHSVYGNLLTRRNAVSRPVSSVNDAIELIINEKLSDYRPYILVHDWMALRMIAKKNDAVKVPNIVVGTVEYGAASQNKEIIRKWNSFLKTIRNDGRYDELFNKWFSNLKLPNVIDLPRIKASRGESNQIESLSIEYAPKHELVDYLKFLNSGALLSKYKGGSKDSDRIFSCLTCHYNKTWFPYLREVLHKGNYERPSMLVDFMLDGDVQDIIPLLLKPPYLMSESGITTLVAFAEKHPEEGISIKDAYDQHLLKKLLTFDFIPKCAEEEFSEAQILVYEQGLKSNQKTIDVKLGQPAVMKLLESDRNKPMRIRVNNITGVLGGMMVSGSKEINIFSIDTGIIETIKIPPQFVYTGISNDGKTIYLDYERHRLFLNTETKNVYKIVPINPLLEEHNRDAARGMIAGLGYFDSSRTENGETIYLEIDSQNEKQCNIYLQGNHKGKLSDPISFLILKSIPKHRFLVDDKLFYSSAGANAEPYGVIDLTSGLKIDAGYSGNLVRVGPHQLYYCSSEDNDTRKPFYYLINTQTLKKTKIEAIPCPGGTGRMEQHPKSGYFIYIDWVSC
jgi:ankyrin repeat protein